MALRSLVTKMRIPLAARAALRTPSMPRVSPPSTSRAFASSSSSGQGAREWYLYQRARYDEVTKFYTSYRREVIWTARLAKLLTWTYRLGLPYIVISKGIAYRKM